MLACQTVASSVTVASFAAMAWATDATSKAPGDEDRPLLTVAEKSEYRATSRSADVVRYIDRLAEAAGHVQRYDAGHTVEGRPIVSAIVAQPAIASPKSLGHDSRRVVLLLGNIHSGECAGKEALLMLIRELARRPDHPWLKNLILVFVPNYNADGNDRMAKTNRPGQVGPEAGMGQRANAQDLDLNREYVKLESPECRALVKLFNQWDPDLFIDTHTTNGSRHRYQLTYDIPKNPAAPEAIRRFMRDEMMPEITGRLRRQKLETFYYGNFNDEHTRWTTYGDTPRYGTEYYGMRGRLSILSEAYAYITYRQRIEATRAFVSECLNYTSKHSDQIGELLERVDKRATNGGRKPASGDMVPLSATIAPFEKKFRALGYELEPGKSRHEQASTTPKDYQVDFYGRFLADRQVQRPFAYLLPADAARVVDRLLMHGIELRRITEEVELDVERYRVDKVSRAERPFQGHRTTRLEVSIEEAAMKMEAGSYLVPTGQPLGNLIVYLLEPTSEDGLVTWNFFDEGLSKGRPYPVLRMPGPVSLSTKPVTRVPANQRLNLDKIYGPEGRIALSRPARTARWIAGKDIYSISIDGRSLDVDAATGARVRRNAETNATDALAALPEVSRADAQRAAVRPLQRSADGTGQLFSLAQDLFYWHRGEAVAVRLTDSSDAETLARFSPDGKLVAFVRNHDLHVVDVEGKRERALTNGGSEQLLHGELDWVYQEELYGRGKFQAFWWSPDSNWIALLELDESPVTRFTVTDNIPYEQRLEITGYPVAGAPNPRVRIGIVRPAGGDVRWIDSFEYSRQEILISRVDWSPEGEQLVYQVQDRKQTWLDLQSVSPVTGDRKRILRETSPAWVESLGSPNWLDDGSFLWQSERSGTRHLYRVSPDGSQVESVTGGPWNVRSVHGVDQENGWVYFSAYKDQPTALQAYRVKLDGSRLACLTPQPGSHRIRMSDSFEYFVDSWSRVTQPSQTRLHRANGSFVRIVDPNLDDRLRYYELSTPERHRIKTRDGAWMNAMLIKPTDFHADRKYPVLVYVYSGPQSPTVRDRWSGSTYLWHQMLAQRGYAIWMCDNRSAGTGGARDAWTSYGQFGTQELKDIEDGLNWLKNQPWVDGNRLGIWGWSFGGYMTGFALTHSTLFGAGIAGAPVTDWRNYDSIYTERYMGLPQENPKGYESSSVVAAADQLHGRLLIIHGTIDDNVHIANTMQLVNALQKQNRQFDVMVYPQNRHGVRRTRHLRELMTQFLLKNL